MNNERFGKSQPYDYFPLPQLFAFTSLKKARKFVIKATGLRFESSGKSATFNAYRNEDGNSFGVILLQCENEAPMQKYACLAHECVHYARAFSEDIGAGQLEEETEAYVVQSAILACIDQIGEEWFIKTPQV